MKIALIHDWLTVDGGAERVIRVLHDIYPEAPIFTTIYNKENFPDLKDAKIVTSFLNKIPMAHKRHQIFIPMMPKAVESFDLSGFDIILSESHACARGVIKPKNSYHIGYCHTPLRYVWLPEIDDRASTSWLRRRAADYLKKWDLATVDRVDRYYGNSKYICQRIQDIYHRPADPIYPPVETSLWRTSKKVGDYFLFVSRLVNHKKPDIVIEAFNKLGLPLKIVGGGPELPRLKTMANSNITFTGRVSDEELKDLYSQTQALIFPSIDDFGLVPIEVMASGRPVIAINIGGAAETIIDNKTGLHFNEQTPESIIEAVRRFKPEEYKTDEIVAWAKTFDTEVFKEKIRLAVEEAQEHLILTRQRV